MVIPGWAAVAAVVVAAVSWLGWIVAIADDDTAPRLLTLAAATLFWLATMLVVAYLVQRGVSRYRERHKR